MDRDQRRDTRNTETANEADLKRAVRTARPAVSREASPNKVEDILDRIMDERADVFRRLAQ